MTKKFIDHLPLVTAVLIYYAYCNLYYYYKEFKVDIYNYVSNSELILSFLPTIVVITATIGTYIISYVIGRTTRDKNDEQKIGSVPEEQPKLKPARKGLFQKPFFIIVIFLAIGVILFFVSRHLLKTHNNKRYELKEYFLYLSFFQAFSTYLILKGLGGSEVFSKYSLIISLALVIYIGKEIGNYRKLEAAEVKDGVAAYRLSFKYNDSEQYQTDSTLIFIGQTQSTLFLYNRRDSSTLIFKKEKVDSLSIK